MILFFDKADSLQSNTEELYELYYSPSESAYANFADLRKKLDFDYGKNTTAKGNALEKKDRFIRSFFIICNFSYYKGKSNVRNNIGVTGLLQHKIWILLLWIK